MDACICIHRQNPAVLKHPLLGNRRAEQWLVTQVWLFWGPSWNQCSNKTGAGEGVGGLTKLALSPVVFPHPLSSSKNPTAGDTVGWDELAWLCHSKPALLLYSLSEMLINAAEQFPQLRRAQNPISKVILELFKRELTIIWGETGMVLLSLNP